MHQLPQLLQEIGNFLEKNHFPDAPRELYEPCEYILQLGGKRIRPALALMAYELFDERIQQALPVAAAVELFHNFTLMHDDIMDAAPLRRGKPTVHTQYNVNSGILSGDVMLIFAYEFLASFRDKKIGLGLVKIFNKIAIGVCEGQQMDVNFEARNDVSIAEYTRMIEMKTAILLGGALEMGAYSARASLTDAENLYHFGRLAGIAFQIQDDFLDTYGDPASFGKQVGGDILQNKKTLLVLEAHKVASATDRQALEKWMSSKAKNPEEKIAAVKAIFDRNDVPARVMAAKAEYQRKAFRHLDAVSVPDERKAVLRKTFEDLLVRQN